MDQINSFLDKFKRTLFAEENRREAVMNSILSVSGINLDRDKVEIKGSDVVLKCSPIERNEIYLNKTQILNSIKESGVKGLNNIR